MTQTKVDTIRAVISKLFPSVRIFRSSGESIIMVACSECNVRDPVMDDDVEPDDRGFLDEIMRMATKHARCSGMETRVVSKKPVTEERAINFKDDL